MLGDGGIRNYQVTVSFHKRLEVAYAEYVRELIQQLFGLMATRADDQQDNSLNLVVSSVARVELLESLG
jgi:hypothetical protein